jgi:ADP-heptose:LPS heptosyltransferase
MAGIHHVPPPDLGWLDADIAGLGLPPRFALLVPGASPGRPGKRWPTERYGALAAGLELPAVVVGGPVEAPLAEAIARAAPPGRVLSLVGRTDFPALGAVARRAVFAVGNDTGPTHLIAAAGCPTLALFGAESDPALCAPRGRAVAVLRHPDLATLEVAEVRTALAGLVAD